MPRGSRPGERRGGRQKGTPNKTTGEWAAFCRAFVTDPRGIATMLRKYRAGTLHPSLVAKLIAHGFGEPKQPLEFTGDEARPVRIVHVYDPKGLVDEKR